MNCVSFESPAVRDPDRAGAEGDVGRRRARRERLDDSRGRNDAKHRPRVRVDEPEGAVADRERRRSTAGGDAPHDLTRLGVDADDRSLRRRSAVDPEASSSRSASAASAAARSAEPTAVATSAIQRRRLRRAGACGARSASSWARIACWSSWSSGPGSRPELGDERLARVRVRVERLGLTARAVEREHQLCAQPLAQQVRADERRQLADELRVPPAGEIGVDPRLERCEPLLLELASRRRRERLVREIGERASAPELERAPERLRRRARPTVAELAAPSLDERSKALEVELLGCDLEGVARALA